MTPGEILYLKIQERDRRNAASRQLLAKLGPGAPLVAIHKETGAQFFGTIVVDAQDCAHRVMLIIPGSFPHGRAFCTCDYWFEPAVSAQLIDAYKQQRCCADYLEPPVKSC